MNGGDYTYIWEADDWPTWRFDLAALAQPLADVSRAQGLLMGRLADVGVALRDRASLSALTDDVVKTSEIEGEQLNVESVRSSIARRLGVDIGALASVDRHVEGVVEMVLDATHDPFAPLTRDRLFGWHAALFPTGFLLAGTAAAGISAFACARVAAGSGAVAAATAGETIGVLAPGAGTAGDFPGSAVPGTALAAASAPSPAAAAGGVGAGGASGVAAPAGAAAMGADAAGVGSRGEKAACSTHHQAARLAPIRATPRSADLGSDERRRAALPSRVRGASTSLGGSVTASAAPGRPRRLKVSSIMLMVGFTQS
jgi:hypothetical protein